MKIRPSFLKSGLILLVAVFLVGVVSTWYYFSNLSKPLNFGSDTYLIEHGDSLSSIAARLVDRGIIDEPYTLKIHSRMNKYGARIKAGEYRFPEGTTLAEFVQMLVKGRGQIGIKVTIIEGWTFQQMREAINNAPKLKHTTLRWSNEQIMESMGKPGMYPEGQFYPETYHYRRGDSDVTIFKKSFNLMHTRLEKAWTEKKSNGEDDLQVKNKYQALILASIIEKETQAREEQPHISGVFNNRLGIGMRLQSDPTVIYGAGDDYNGNITRKHLKTDTPYNTYTRYGLPPTPICLPGYDSLYAAVNPKKTKSLYFVAKGGGKHKFSSTLKEHNVAVDKYILNK